MTGRLEVHAAHDAHLIVTGEVWPTAGLEVIDAVVAVLVAAPWTLTIEIDVDELTPGFLSALADAVDRATAAGVRTVVRVLHRRPPRRTRRGRPRRERRAARLGVR